MNQKVKDWYKRHKDLEILEGWDKKEYDYILEKIITEDYNILQDLLLQLNNKSIDELVNLLSNHLKIGNKKLDIELHCANCGKAIIRNMAEYKKERVYCNMQCRDMFFSNSGMRKGKNNPSYNSEISKCTNCGKEIVLPKYKTKQKNRFNDTHNFCSQQCYWDYRKIYYVGEKSSMYNFKCTERQRQKYRENTVKLLSENKFSSKITSIHVKINNLLDKLCIEYINEYPCKYYCIDIYLPQYDLMIEIMGDYFHANPTKYTSVDLLDNIQKNDVKRDKSKHSYIKKYKGIEILYLWEYDINNRIDICEELIKQYIFNNGILENYHSYNY